jgi:2-oxoglutarate/2-oxoacid ferredoxin oxidoreductase subunit alpha
MNERLTRPFVWDDAKRMDRGKVVTRTQLEAGEEFGRYVDIDGDGITWRTYPGTHPRRGSFFTRGTSRDEYARYSESGAVYERNMERLLKKFETIKRYVPAPVRRDAAEPTRLGAIYYGSTAAAMDEAAEQLVAEGVAVDLLRVRSFPFHDEVAAFIAEHDRVFVVEQNRDGQLRSMLITELEIDPKKLLRLLHYDGSPVTARFIAYRIAHAAEQLKIVPLRTAAPAAE